MCVNLNRTINVTLLFPTSVKPVLFGEIMAAVQRDQFNILYKLLFVSLIS